MYAPPARRSALALALALASTAAGATQVRILPMEDNVAGTPLASAVDIRLVDEAGTELRAIRATDGTPITTTYRAVIPAGGPALVIDLVPQSQIARPNGAPTWYRFRRSSSGVRATDELVQVPDSPVVQDLSALVGGAAVNPADILAGRLLPTPAGLPDNLWLKTLGGAWVTTSAPAGGGGAGVWGGITGMLSDQVDLGLALAPGASAYGWGDHAQAGYLLTETDPVYALSAAAGITSTHTSNWGTAYGWGDHAQAGYLMTETDPVYAASPAAGIDADAIGAWDQAAAGEMPMVALGDLDAGLAFADHGSLATARLVADGDLTITLPTSGAWHSVLYLTSDTGDWELTVVGNVLRRVGSVSLAPALGQVIEVVITATPTLAIYSAVVLE